MKRIDKRMWTLLPLLFGFWVILTGSFNLINLLLGLLVSIFTSYFSFILLKKHFSSININFRIFWRFCICAIKIIKDIFQANTDVGERVMDPKMPISPAVIKFKSNLSGFLPKVILASFITLRPGTLAVDFEGDIIYVHCIADEFAKELMERKLENSINWIFEEGKRS